MDDGDRSWRDLLADGRLPRFALICLGVWLNAADSLVTATIMPSVGASLGGYAYFSWTIAGFMVGAIMAGASAGRFAEVFGLRQATAVAGLVFAGGCVAGAMAPTMPVFVAGRIVQGLGSGWISGFAMVAIAVLFPARHLARVFAAVAGVWGIATVVGPLVGGLFAAAGDWRAVFWLFAGQAVLFSIAAPFLLKSDVAPDHAPGIPWGQLGVLSFGVTAIAVADITRMPLLAGALVVGGLAILALVFRLDRGSRVRLLPHRAGDLRTVVGTGYLAIFASTAAAMPITVYGPAILQQLRGLTPIEAGYAIAAEACMWTVMAFAVSGAVSGSSADRAWIRRGALCIFIGVAMLALVTRSAPLALVCIAAGMMGAGFGLSTAFTNQRIMSALADEDRAIGSSALIAVRQTGGAVGAAIAGVAANVVGFGTGLTDATASAAAVWVFVPAIPLALAALWASWRLTGGAIAPVRAAA